jgi:hypothetical protein
MKIGSSQLCKLFMKKKDIKKNNKNIFGKEKMKKTCKICEEKIKHKQRIFEVGWHSFSSIDLCQNCINKERKRIYSILY